MSYKNHPYYTHQPYLIEILKNTTGNILECGCGEGSTLVIKNSIKNTERKLVSLESNLQWLSKFSYLKDSNHQLLYVPANNDDNDRTGKIWTDFVDNNLTDIKFEIVFIDSAPWSSRTHLFNYFKNKAKIMIIHDFDYFPTNNILGKIIKKESFGDLVKITCDLDGVVKNYKLYYPPYDYFAYLTGPPTLVCSNIMDKEEFNNLMNKIESELGKYYSNIK